MLTIYIVLIYLGISSSMPVAAPFQFTINKNSSQIIALGKKATIDCETDSSYAKVTLWKIEGKQRRPIVDGPDVFVGDDEFVIKSFLSKDIGTYMCEAIDISSGQKLTRFVTIAIDLSQPALEMSPRLKHLTALTKSTIVLVCEGIGSKVIEWEFIGLENPSELHSAKYTMKTTYIGLITRSVLTMYDVTRGLTGRIKCKLNLGQRRKSLSEGINILIRDPQAPLFKNPNPETFTIGKGKHQVLQCVVNGYPSVTISWEKDVKPLSICRKIYQHPCAGDPYIYVNSTAIKISSAVFPRDDGTYTCTASNKFGSAKKTFHVIVEEKPELDRHPTIVARRNRDPKFPIVCKAKSGNPPPKFTWQIKFFYQDYNGNIHAGRQWYSKQLSSWDHSITLSANKMSSTITVPSKIQSAYYKCTARNSAGTATHVITFWQI